jgi:hypothetical protein
MTREQLIEQLTTLPSTIQASEELLLKQADRVRTLEDDLKNLEAELVREGKLGTNDMERKANLKRQTADEYELVLEAISEREGLAIVLRRDQNAFSAAKALARLLSPSE